ncbi:FliM/FliN family flagellar motor switch protein [uncultured Shimia sp.]|uniref:FliM/FliN family flagellar motor switch protein n=1 Tax=uncultured Shimia sp. TaxID=573152 RepID=UPI00261A3FE5|nr:FliM/FliN family flagellar motor switch protein [uncultured Shimia sp.]
MSETQATSILRRKAADGRTEHQARAMTPNKALRLGLALAAEKGMDLALDVTDVRHVKLPHRAVEVTLDNESLLILLEGQNGEPGALAMDMQVMAGLVEFQTLGQVVPKPVTDRVPTKVDAALITPFLEDALMRYVRMLAEEGEAPYWLQHYKFGAMMLDTRTLSLAMTAQDYHMFVLDVKLERGKKTGTMALLFPDVQVLVNEPEEDAETDAEKFQNGVKEATTLLNAVVGKISLPIAQIQGLQVGDTLPLGEEAMQNATLQAPTGEEITEVRIGQLNGMRAVCVPGLVGAVAPSTELTVPDTAEMSMADMGAPEMPAMEMPSMDMPSMDMPAMGGMDDIGGDLPGMAEMPALDGAGLPDMGGDLPDLGGELPDLGGGGLPDLEPMGEMGVGLDADNGMDDFAGLDDLDDLIQLGNDEIGDPAALADLDLTGT